MSWDHNTEMKIHGLYSETETFPSIGSFCLPMRMRDLDNNFGVQLPVEKKHNASSIRSNRLMNTIENLVFPSGSWQEPFMTKVKRRKMQWYVQVSLDTSRYPRPFSTGRSRGVCVGGGVEGWRGKDVSPGNRGIIKSGRDLSPLHF